MFEIAIKMAVMTAEFVAFLVIYQVDLARWALVIAATSRTLDTGGIASSVEENNGFASLREARLQFFL